MHLRLPLLSVLAALTLPLSAQNRAERDSLPQAARRAGAAAPGNMQTPAGEAPGPWILGTIGVGKTADPKVPKTTALKGLAIKVGAPGEAAVAYDLDLCRMVGAWTGKFTTPMNLMSRGEYPTALGEVAFTTGEVPGFLLGGDPSLQSKTAILQGKMATPPPQERTPPPQGSAPPPQERTPPPQGSAPPPQERTPPPQGSAPPPQERTPPPQGSAPPPQERTPPPQGSAPPPQERTPPPQGSAPPPQERTPPPQGSTPPRAETSLLTSVTAPVTGWTDPRPEPFGPLPPGQARFKGFYVNGDKTILKWDIGGTEVLEMPGYDGSQSPGLFTRTFRIAPTTLALSVAIAPVHPKLETELREKGASLDEIMLNKTWFAEAVKKGQIADRDVPFIDFAGACIVPRVDTDGSVKPTWHLRHDHLWVEVPPHDQPLLMRFTFYGGREDIGQKAIGRMLTEKIPPIADLAALTKGGSARWPETVTTAGEVSAKTDEAYVVDTIKLPDPNPWGAPMFVGGFDFFPDGRAGSPKGQPPLVPGAATSAVCTFHGDVFVVSGIDAKLEKVTWKRFASGLYHALGLKIVNGEIHVTCRDGLWRLKDLNGDGECDFYEAFNFDLKVTKSFHEFVFDLQTDPAGNFYYAKAGPVKNGGRGFDEIMAHHGSLLRVSPDGAKLDVVATGFRAPNGIGCGPDGQLTSGDNEGTWTPACKINWIAPGGFYGVVPLAHRDPPPTDYDRPLCWLPKRVDNSGGGQVWVPPGERWGPWGGQMLHLSYGTCSVFGVMWEQIVQKDTLPPSAVGVPFAPNPHQGGVVRFPVNFQSGIMRARFNPQDGQLYVAGLRGWQTTGVKNGAFQRVRYTGALVRMPIGLHATYRGVRLDFTTPLDPATANDAQNWNVEVWNYLWSEAYGSPEFSTAQLPERAFELDKNDVPQFTKAQAAQKKHDALTVKSATLSADGRSVFLEIPEIKPVMQMAIKFGLQTADGAELRSEVINTIHALSAE